MANYNVRGKGKQGEQEPRFKNNWTRGKAVEELDQDL